MAPKKRPAAAPATVAASKKPAVAKATAKKPAGFDEGVKEKIETIKEVLSSTELLPSSTASMLAGALMHSLALYKEDRHEVQTKAVEMVGSALDIMLAAYEKAISDSAEKLTEAKASEEEKKEELTKAEAAVEEATKTVEEKDKASEEGEVKVATAKAALAEAEEAQTKGDEDLASAETKKANLESVMAEMYTPIKEGTSPTDARAVNAFMKKLKDFSMSIDSSLMGTAPAAMTKAPAERGEFDKVVFDSFDSEFSKLMEGFEKTLADGEPGKAERAAAVEKAQAELTEAEASNTTLSEEAATAAKALKEAQAVVKAAKKAVKEAGPAVKAAASSQKVAEAALAEFKDGALAAYKELAERCIPPPEPVEEEMPAAEEPAAPAEEAPAAAE
mmetsp:Transcript_59640/g.141916  ORF Transcript_59640/g.141916 Transcript_59640/m.141916 type:complete len:390 (+) Transcript_59640:123-1292(+)|eukprot:CAMPEP_0178386152 /NCGR_PEP_ID=MMETSP0689_2-20121128/8406_1 /TAXON_ID=160604 /ORGANISM="Amphidinium massartii, Strain CS-259" /LENGTH=389 /DNA_ID=CAMNT_0020006467 /DNA_START=111 /DNA_END=1280 /DNA_ORIENTATION=-